MVKYNLKFTVSAEALFDFMSKILPIENLDVEQINEHFVPIDQETKTAIRFDKKFTLPKPKRKNRPKIHRISAGPNLKEGINGIIIAHLSDGVPHKAEEFRPLLKAAGYSESSVSSRIEELRKHSVVERMKDGYWRLAITLDSEVSK